jgi:hypothetical protein
MIPGELRSATTKKPGTDAIKWGQGIVAEYNAKITCIKQDDTLADLADTFTF